jgi:protein-disulfide isomerase
MKAIGLSSLIAAFFLSAVAPVSAQTGSNPLASREAALPNVLSWLQTQGVKLTFIGDEGGLRGYLGESANGKMQTFYVSPDGNYVAAGVLFKAGGTNVTGVQIGEMRSRFENASKPIVDATVGDGAASSTKSADRPAGGSSKVEIKKDPAPPVPVEVKPTAPGPQTKNDVKDSAIPEKTSGLTLPPPSGPIAGELGNRSDLWISKMSRSEFITAAEKAPFFEVGAVSARPVIWMVADPQCPYCHKAWDRLEKLVYNKKARVRVILMAGLNGSEPKAREILARPVPARAWLDSKAGTNIKQITDTATQEWQTAGIYVGQNGDFARKFGINQTPFLAYVGENGSFYSALGLPSDLDAFLAASGAI